MKIGQWGLMVIGWILVWINNDQSYPSPADLVFVASIVYVILSVILTIRDPDSTYI